MLAVVVGGVLMVWVAAAALVTVAVANTRIYVVYRIAQIKLSCIY